RRFPPRHPGCPRGLGKVWTAPSPFGYKGDFLRGLSRFGSSCSVSEWTPGAHTCGRRESLPMWPQRRRRLFCLCILIPAAAFLVARQVPSIGSELGEELEK